MTSSAAEQVLWGHGQQVLWGVGYQVAPPIRQNYRWVKGGEGRTEGHKATTVASTTFASLSTPYPSPP